MVSSVCHARYMQFGCGFFCCGYIISHYNDVIMSAMASQNTTLTILYSIVYSGADQRKHQSSASLAFVRGIHRWPVNTPHKGPVTRKMFPFDDVIMVLVYSPGPLFTNKTPLYMIGITIINLRWSSDRLRFIMGIRIPIRRGLLCKCIRPILQCHFPVTVVILWLSQW